jgi:hypothetical protein
MRLTAAVPPRLAMKALRSTSIRFPLALVRYRARLSISRCGGILQKIVL